MTKENLMHLADEYATLTADTAAITKARAALEAALEKVCRDAKRWAYYRSKAGADVPNPFWCLRVIDGEVDRMADKAMKENT